MATWTRFNIYKYSLKNIILQLNSRTLMCFSLAHLAATKLLACFSSPVRMLASLSYSHMETPLTLAKCAPSILDLAFDSGAMFSVMTIQVYFK